MSVPNHFLQCIFNADLELDATGFVAVELPKHSSASIPRTILAGTVAIRGIVQGGLEFFPGTARATVEIIARQTS